MGPGLEQWEGSLDAKGWPKQAKGGKQCWITVIIGSHLNWVEHKSLDLLEEKHATLVAVINRGNRGGKVMLVWDSDRRATPLGLRERATTHINSGPVKAVYNALRDNGRNRPRTEYTIL
ncbi:hypothetical protein V2G26_015703 [Clonostachys chloroleuca]